MVFQIVILVRMLTPVQLPEFLFLWETMYLIGLKQRITAIIPREVLYLTKLLTWLFVASPTAEPVLRMEIVVLAIARMEFAVTPDILVAQAMLIVLRIAVQATAN